MKRTCQEKNRIAYNDIQNNSINTKTKIECGEIINVTEPR